MHQDYSQPATRVASDLRDRNASRDTKSGLGKPDDWGKTMPFWCLSCGQGSVSVERVLAHYAEAGHGNESMSVGSRALTKEQRLQAFRLRNK
jgi:hypothetical protein